MCPLHGALWLVLHIQADVYSYMVHTHQHALMHACTCRRQNRRTRNTMDVVQKGIGLTTARIASCDVPKPPRVLQTAAQPPSQCQQRSLEAEIAEALHCCPYTALREQEMRIFVASVSAIPIPQRYRTGTDHKDVTVVVARVATVAIVPAIQR